MKRFFVILLVFSLVAGFAAADDLSSLSIEELRALVLDINAEIAGRDDWQGADVPAGLWTVGVDIPAGVYSISLADSKGAYLTVKNEKGRLVVNSGIRRAAQEVGKVTLAEGYTVEIEGGTLHFGRPVSLGF